VPLLYHWKREQFLVDNQSPLNADALNLSQDSPVLANAAGHRLWAFTRDCGGVYILAASAMVERVERLGSSLGEYTALAKPGSTVKYRLLNPVVDLEPTIRSLSIRTEAGVLGSSFQGNSAVRELTESDDQALEQFASQLKRAAIGFRWKPAGCK